jgi:glycosyltransferase involved in cell wall biosynthesis
MSFLSVIIPVYNSEHSIAATLESVIAQTHTDFEILIIDDGSSDRSIEICQRYNDPRLRIIHQQNRGLAGARNTGIRQAKGQYLAFLDSDDLWHPQKLAKHLEHFEANPLLGVSFSRSCFIDEQGKALGIYQMPKLVGITPGYLFCRNPISNGSAVVIRREVLEAIQFEANLYGEPEIFYFDDRFRQSEDIECWLRIALQTDWIIEGIPEALTLYRVNTGGLSANILKQFDYWEQIVTKTQAYNPEFVEQWAAKARAYQYRYLARRAASQRSPTMATQLLHKALASDWRILVEEPRRTLLTIVAVYLLRLLPARLYQQIEAWAMILTGASQKRQIQQEQHLEQSCS